MKPLSVASIAVALVDDPAGGISLLVLDP